MKLLIGLDIGTTALKAAVFDTAGKLLAVSTQEYDLITPQVNYVEEKGEVYWNAFKHAVGSMRKKRRKAPRKKSKNHLKNNMLPSYRTMKYKSPIWGYFHVWKK